MSNAADGVQPSFTVCIPSVRAGTVEHAIESVRRQTFADWELIVVVQGDDPALRKAIEGTATEDSRIRALFLDDTGVSLARNAGVRAARSEIVAFLDDDCEAEPDWLALIWQAFADEPDVGMVAGSLVAPPGPRWPISVCPEAHPRSGTVRPTPDDPSLPPGVHVVTANLAVRRWVWDSIGLFDEELGAGSSFRGGEDLDLLLRAARHGVPIRLLPEAIVHHTYGRRAGLRAVWRIVTGYGSGQGAVAAKMTLSSTPGAASWNGAAWRRRAWQDGVVTPLRTLRPHRLARTLPRLLAFDRSYRRAARDYAVHDDGLLHAREV